MNLFTVLRVLTVDFYRRHPVRGFIGLAGVAVGTAVAASINLTSAAAVDSFSESIESVTGKANLQISSGRGFSEADLWSISWLWDIGAFSPSVQMPASLNAKPVQLLGFDLIGDYRIRDVSFSDSTSPPDLSGVFLPVDSPFGTTGDTLVLVVNAREVRLRVAGMLTAISGYLPPRQAILADLSLFLPLRGSFTHLDIQVPADSLESVRDRLAERFPTDRVQTLTERKNSTRQLFSAFRMNLQALGLIALLVAGYLVYNTLYLSVIQRRQTLHLLLTLGCKHRDLMLAVLAEGLLFGVTGGLAGLALGFLASGITGQEVEQTLTTVFQLTGSGRSGFQSLAMGGTLLLSVVFCMLAAIYPARLAGKTPAAMGLKRGLSEYSTRRIVWLTGAAVVSAVSIPLCIGLAAETRNPLFGYGAVIGAVAALSLLTPLVLSGLIRLLRILPPTGVLSLATGAVREHLMKVAIAAAALTITLSMAGAVVVMVHSFRVTVTDWLTRSIQADLYFKSSADPTLLSGTMDAGIISRLENASPTKAVMTLRTTQILMDGNLVDVGGNEIATYLKEIPVSLLAGGADSLESRMKRGWVLASEGYAFRFNQNAGDTARIASFGIPIAGIYRNYSSDRGFLLMDTVLYFRIFGQTDPVAAAVFLKPGTTPGAALPVYREVLDGVSVDIAENATIRRQAIDIFDQTFRLTTLLQVISVAMAFMAIITTLLAMIWDRKKEWAMLLAFGSKPWSMAAALMVESLMMTGTALILAAAGSWTLATILISVINKYSFGWTITTDWPLTELGLIGIAMVFAGLIASVLPWRSIQSLQIAKALKPTLS